MGLLLVITLALPSILFASVDRRDGFPIVESFSAADAGTAGSSWVVSQDAAGTLHVGSTGLLSFDGERWLAAPMKEAYALRGLDPGPGGKLWAGAFGEVGWFERVDGRYAYRSLCSFLPEEHRNFGEVMHAFDVPGGAVFITEDRVLQWDGQSFRIWPFSGVRRLFAVRHGSSIFVHHKPTGLYLMRETGPELFLPASILGQAAVFWVERRETRWRLITSDGLFEWWGGLLQPIAPAASALIKSGNLTGVVALPDDRLALGTYSGGIVVIDRDGNVDRVVTEADGLPTPVIYSLFVDRDQQLWATAASHVFRLSLNSASSVFDRRAGLPERPIRRIVSHEGRLYVIDEEKIYALDAERRRFTAVTATTEPPRGIYSLASRRGLWATSINRVKELSPTGAQLVYTGRSDLHAIEPERGRDDSFLLGEGRRVMRLTSNGSASEIAVDLPDIASSIAEDPQGRLWLGSSGRGLMLLTRDGVVRTGSGLAAFSLPDVTGPTTTLATQDGDILVFNRRGAWIKKPGEGTFRPVEYFPAREIAAVSPSRERNAIWVVLAKSSLTPPTIGRVSIEGDRAVWNPHAVEGLARIGVPHSIFAEAVGAGRTVLWIGGTGIVRHEVENGPAAPKPRPPLLRVAARDGRGHAALPITGPLPYSTETIEFEFAAPQFAARPELRLETRLDGVDREWIPGGPTSRRELTAMRDGRYTFRVRAVADTGVASDEAVFSFQILPPWWRTGPAMLAAAVALAPIGYGFYRLRIRSLRRRNAELEAKVRERTEELEAANAAKTQFVANMSHDIRNPLNGIVGLALALEDTRLEPRQREIVSTLRECTTYLSSLVDDVLDFASIEAGRVELRPGPFAAPELLRSIVETLRADATESGAQLSVHCDSALPATLVGDAGRIQQILVNFVSNALKYAGGAIRLSAGVPPGAPDEVEFAVTDAGPGIGAADQATLFTKFTRLRSRHGDQDIPGAGLGLAACRLLADIMGGSVGVVSGEGRGARFFLRLPLAAAAAAEAPPPAGSNLPNTTVLLVEDTDYNAWAASAVLARLGLACERARTGAEAVRLFGERRFNVVLLDRNLPDMDGTEVARRMRDMEPDGRQAVLLAVTAYCTAEDRALCLQAGMDAFVGKPLTPEKLRRVLLEAGRRLLAAASVHVPPDQAGAEPDMTLLSYLADGAPDGLAVQVQRFLAALEETALRLRTDHEARDLATLAVHAHELCGQGRMVGSTALAEAGVQLESAANSGDLLATARALQRAHDEIQALTAAMRHRYPAGQPA